MEPAILLCFFRPISSDILELLTVMPISAVAILTRFVVCDFLYVVDKLTVVANLGKGRIDLLRDLIEP